MSTEQKHLLFSDTLLEYRGIPLEKVADIVANQLTMEDQKKIVSEFINVLTISFDYRKLLVRCHNTISVVISAKCVRSSSETSSRNDVVQKNSERD